LRDKSLDGAFAVRLLAGAPPAFAAGTLFALLPVVPPTTPPNWAYDAILRRCAAIEGWSFGVDVGEDKTLGFAELFGRWGDG